MIIQAIKKTELFIKKILLNLFKKRSLDKLIKHGDYKNLPVYIISYNRFFYVKQTVEWLKQKGYYNTTIIDNNSDYPPLLKYFETSP